MRAAAEGKEGGDDELKHSNSAHHTHHKGRSRQWGQRTKNHRTHPTVAARTSAEAAFRASILLRVFKNGKIPVKM